jgi:hypothetical protein
MRNRASGSSHGRPRAPLHGSRLSLVEQPGAGHEHGALVRQVRVDGVPLHTGAFGDHADRRAVGPDLAMQRQRRLDDALPRLGFCAPPVLPLV